MKKKTIFSLGIGLGFIILVGGLWLLTDFYLKLPEQTSQHETIILGQNHFVPGSRAGLRVVTRDSREAAPLENAEIRVSLQSNDGSEALELYSGVSDAHGTANITFEFPTDIETEQTLVIETTSSLGTDRVERPVVFERNYKVLLTSDKPIYQPGQIIHLRALALGAFDLKPAASQELTFIIADGKGNKVFRETVPTSEWGVAAIDFQLASQVNTGAYKISAVLSSGAEQVEISGSAEKTVRVEHYVLPKFEVTVETEKTYYLPGERVAGTLRANYFFGEPVAGGEIAIEGYTFDVDRNIVVTVQGVSDENGDFAFSFDLPEYILGTELDAGQGRFYLQAAVTDLTQHTEISNQSFPIAQNALVIEAIPEGGQFKAGVENILYVLTSYPDGTPADTFLNLAFSYSGETINAETGNYGLAEILYTPSVPRQEISIRAIDQQGNTALKEFYFEGQWSEEAVLLRSDKPVYFVGETMNLTLLTSVPAGTAYLDIVREGQTIHTQAVDIENGNAQIAIDLSPDLYGTLELQAYRIMQSGNIVRDTRLVVVDQANDLNLTLTPDLDNYNPLSAYKPGEMATVDVQVRDWAEKGYQAAIGFAVVDEAVFALAEQDPGFAKLFFLLEQELLQPKYDLHGFSLPDLVGGVPVSSQAFVDAIESSAQASLAEATLRGGEREFSLQANSHEDAIQRAGVRQKMFFNSLGTALFIVILMLSIVSFILGLIAVVQAAVLGRSLILALFVLILPVLTLWIWPHPWATSPLEKLTLFFDWLSWQGEAFLLGLTALALVGWIALIVVAIRKKDGLLGWILGLIPVFLGILIFTAFAISQSDLIPNNFIIIFGLVAINLLPLSFLLRFAGFVLQRQAIPALGALTISLFLLVGSFAVAFLGSSQIFGKNVGGDLFFEEPVMMEMAADGEMPMADQAEDKKLVETKRESETDESQTPRLRQFFPETMLWLPDAVTDANGDLQIEFPVADNITTWRMTALASTQDGRLGSAAVPLRVFQDFFIDLDLPLALTVGDEIAVPVGVFNYLEEPQSVRLELESADWFELLDQPEKTIEIAAKAIQVVYFKIRATQFGQQPFQITAFGSQMSDAIRKNVRVYPDGKQIHFSASERLSSSAAPDSSGGVVREIVEIPAEAIPGTQNLTVKIYPGIVSQVIEGLDNILQMPNGCFEQTSSTTYPNILVLDYLRSTDQAAPEVQFKAEAYLNLGYQRLTTFEVGGSGGFSLFGDPPPDRMLTAYGLQEFSDMSRVHNVDPDLTQRAAEWLFSVQASNGSWENDRGLVHENTWANLGDDRLPVTAYIVWGLADAGFASDLRTQNALAYVKENAAFAQDAYVVALIANALVSVDVNSGAEITPSTLEVLERLAEMGIIEGDIASWRSGVATFMGSEGQTGSIETTALAALAFLRANRFPELANAALTFLIQQKDNFGTWYSTQATVLALKALIQSVRAGAENVDATVTVTLNDGQTRNIAITSENFDVVQLLTFEDIDIGRENVVSISIEGDGNLMYQVAGDFYLPWEVVANYPQLTNGTELVDIHLRYDRTELAVNDRVGVNVVVMLKEGQAESAIIDLGLPPGFSVETQDLEALVARFDDVPADYAFPTIERYELTGRQILIYVSNLNVDNALEFTYHLRAMFPLVAQTPASNAYDYYNPDVQGDTEPQLLIVQP